MHEDDRIAGPRLQNAEAQTIQIDHMPLEGLVGRDDIGELRRMRTTVGANRRGLTSAPDHAHQSHSEKQSRNHHAAPLSEQADSE
jgi:hypothetical protein